MGWGGGTEIFSVIIQEAVKAVPDKEARKKFYEPILAVFYERDWDTVDECMGVDDAFDELMEEDIE